MNKATIDRYQSGGDIYAALLSSYGRAGADQIALAAQSGDETQINRALVQVKFGQPLNTSTAAILADQLVTDPFKAPLESLNGITGRTFLDILKSPYVIAAAVIIGFFALGGVNVLKALVAKLARKAGK